MTRSTILFLYGISIILGLAGLMAGGELIVTASSALALSLGLSERIVAVTIVAFGSSMPELIVSVIAALEQKPDLCLGNVLGSNIQNISLILSMTCLLMPIRANIKEQKLNLIYFVLSPLVFFMMSYDSVIGRFEGFLLVFCLISFLIISIKSSGQDYRCEQRENELKIGKIILDFALMIISLLVLFVSAKAVVYGASNIARDIGLSERIIGLTIVAFGTSLPEFFISIVGAIRGKVDLVLGNIIGSNIFNLLGIIGVSSLITPMSFDKKAISIDLSLVIFITLICCIWLYFAKNLAKIFGSVFLFIFTCYLGFIFMS